MKNQMLNEWNAKTGLKITNESRPEWGTFTLKTFDSNNNRWSMSSNELGEKRLYTSEMCFWSIVAE